VDGVGIGQQRGQQGVPRFVVGGDFLLLLVDDERSPLLAHQDLVLGHLKIAHHDALATVARSVQGGLVDQVGQLRAGESRRAAGDDLQVHVGADGDLAGVHPQDAQPAADVGQVDDDLAVEPAGPEQRRIEHIGPVGGGDEDNPFVGLEAVHLHQELVQGLLALVVAATQARPAMAAHGVDFVDEDDAGGMLLSLVEQVAHPGGADTDEHLHEVRAADGKERHVGLAGHRARQQGFARPGRPHQEHALRNPPAQLLEFLGLLQELHNLGELLDGLIDAGHVLERDLLLLAGQQLGPAFAEGDGLVAGALHLAHQEHPKADEQDQRQPDGQRPRQPRILLGRNHVDVRAGLDQRVRHLRLRILRHGGGEAVAVAEPPLHHGALDGGLLDGFGVDLLLELGVVQLLDRAFLVAVVQSVKHHHGDDDKQPQQDVLDCIIQLRLRVPSRDRPPDNGLDGDPVKKWPLPCYLNVARYGRLRNSSCTSRP